MPSWAISLVVLVVPGALTKHVSIAPDGSAINLEGIGSVHAEWLRERCLSPSSVDPVTLQRLHGPHEYEPPRVLNASIVSTIYEEETPAVEELVVEFADAHWSTFNVEELRKHAGNGTSDIEESFIQFAEATRPELLLWDAKLEMPPVIPFSKINEPETRLKLYTLLQSMGVVVVRGAPQREKICSEMAANLSTLRVTEWGENFNVRSVFSNAPDVKRDLAYTPKSIGMHTDNPYRYPTPDFQLLHVIEQCECEVFPCEQCSVRNYFADGFAIAERIARESPELFDALATVPVRFENNGGDGTSALWHEAPHIELKPKHAAAFAKPGQGDIPRCRVARCLQAIRFSSKSGGYAPRISTDELEVFYRAKRRFSELAHDPSMYIQLQLRNGDVAIFDNVRLLHARSAILPTDGDRFVQGCYLDRDGIQYNFERTRRAVKSTMPNPKTAHWTSLKTATQQAFDDMAVEYSKINIADQLMSMLRAQAGLYLGQPVDLLEHGLQTASRAYRAGESDDLVVAGLFHDVTEHLVPKGHGEVAAALLAPYIEPAAHWLLTHHEVFQVSRAVPLATLTADAQGYYYFHYFGADPNKRDALRDSPYWELTRQFCENYDQAAFDPSYPSLPINFFIPIVNRVIGRNAYWWDPDHLKATAVTG